MLKIAICEDEPLWMDQLLTILKKFNSHNEWDIYSFTSASDFLKDFYQGKYDLVFMDIYMCEISGVEAVAKIREIDTDVCIAFTTTSLDHALEAYRLNVLKYLEKPVNEKDVLETISLASLKKRTIKKISFTIDKKEETFVEADILYFEQKNHTIMLHSTNRGKLSFTGRLDEIEKLLHSERFYRCHKSYLVNLSQVEQLDKEMHVFIMKDNTCAYITREKLKEAGTILDEFLFNELRKGMQ